MDEVKFVALYLLFGLVGKGPIKKKIFVLPTKFLSKHVNKLGGQNVEFYCVKS